MELKNKKILVVVGGGISAYKSLDLIRLLKRDGFEIKTVLTKSGRQFVTPLSILSLSGVLLTIQGVSEVFRAIICIRTGHWPVRASADAEETEKVLMRTSQ